MGGLPLPLFAGRLVAAANPCPCGYYGDPVKECTCSHGTVLRYQKRISGPLSLPLCFSDLRLDRSGIRPLRCASGISDKDRG